MSGIECPFRLEVFPMLIGRIRRSIDRPGLALSRPSYPPITAAMTGSALQIAWPALAALGYLLVVCYSRVLGARIQQDLQIHDRVRESRLMRLEYLEELARRRCDVADTNE